MLAAMREQLITAAEEREANRAPLPQPDNVRLGGTQGKAPYFSDYVKQQLHVDKFGSRGVYGEGLRVRQRSTLASRSSRARRCGTSRDPEGPAAALVAVDPTTGNVLAMVGGRNNSKSQFNIAVQSRRQLRRPFKPFVLASALEDGISPATHFESQPISIFLGDKYWAPANYEDVYLGDVDLVSATIHSDNFVYAQLVDEPRGPARGVRRRRSRIGVRSPLHLHPVYSIGLGDEGGQPTRYGARSAFANGGCRTHRHAHVPQTGRAWSTRSGHGPGRSSRGTTRGAGCSPRAQQPLGEPDPAAGRLERDRAARVAAGLVGGRQDGTTENYGDAWFVGYSPQLVTAVGSGIPGAAADADRVRGRSRGGGTSRR